MLFRSQGIKKVDLICPGFTSDCLETLEEIAQEAHEAFMHAGGEQFHYIPCLNDNPSWIDAMHEIASLHLAGWHLGEPDAKALAISRSEATARGGT